MLLRKLLPVAALAGLARSKLTSDFISEVLADFSNNTSIDITPIFNYGCWCHFQPHLQRGFGPAQDNYDRNCQQLEENYICADEETYAEGDTQCVTAEADWEYDDYEMDYTEEGIEKCCTESNPGNLCKIRACIIENYFLNEIKGLMIEGVEPTSKLSRNDGFSHWSSECGGGSAATTVPTTTVPMTAPITTSTPMLSYPPEGFKNPFFEIIGRKIAHEIFRSSQKTYF